MDARNVNRSVRRWLWPALEEAGFSVRGRWAVWRYVEGHTDVVDVTTVGRHADAVGCTSGSLTAFVACVPAWAAEAAGADEDAPPGSPRYWEAPLRRQLHKTLSQPWFRPFADPAPERLLPSNAKHREGLRAVMRADVHDRPDIWYVLDDGSNLREVLDDVLEVVRRVGLPALDGFHDPGAVIRSILDDELQMAPDSPAARALIEAAERATRLR
ncbi:MAG TPA: hypothetical protein VF029_03735 [Actinomycetota bacterium]